MLCLSRMGKFLYCFGTARVFKTGNSEDTVCLGTPGYAAPEQYGGNGQTRAQTDIYCLGATMHHLITGRDPAATPFISRRLHSAVRHLLTRRRES